MWIEKLELLGLRISLGSLSFPLLAVYFFRFHSKISLGMGFLLEQILSIFLFLGIND